MRLVTHARVASTVCCAFKFMSSKQIALSNHSAFAFLQGGHPAVNVCDKPDALAGLVRAIIKASVKALENSTGLATGCAKTAKSVGWGVIRVYQSNGPCETGYNVALARSAIEPLPLGTSSTRTIVFVGQCIVLIV